MKSVSKSFDPHCYELAGLVLPDEATEELKNELAQAIQDAIETFLGGLEG